MAASAVGAGLFSPSRRGSAVPARFRLFSAGRFAKRSSAADEPAPISQLRLPTGRRVLPHSIEPLLRIVAALGDAGFVLPASGGLAAAFWAAGDRRAAVAFLGAIALCGVMATVAKIFSMAFGPPALHSPSGHAALAVAFFLPLSAIFMRVRERRAGIFAAALCLAAAVLVAIVRVAQGAHTEPEAFAGFFIGLASFGLFLAAAPAQVSIGAPAIIVFFIAAVAIQSQIGLSIEVEGPLERIATRLAEMLSL